MSNRLQQITIDINSDNNFQYVRAIHGDANTDLAEVSILADGTPYEIDASKLITLRGTKPDGKQILNSCELTNSNTILIKSTEQLTSTLGRSQYEISLYGRSDAQSATTFPFYIVVVESAVNAKTVVSSNEYTALQQAFTNIDSKITLANQTISTMNNLKEELDSNESERQNNEELRQSQETDREENERNRQSQEEKRQNDTDMALYEASIATLNLVNAVASANEAAEKATQAAQECKAVAMTEEEFDTIFYSIYEKNTNTEV